MDRREFFAVTGVGLVAGRAQATLPLLKSTINGGRPRGSHPELPTTPEECARTARAVAAAGAGAIHVHIRNTAGAESLAAADLARTLTAMRAAAPGTPLGISTHARILNDVARRLDAVAGWTELPDFASVNFHEEGAAELAAQLIDRGVGVEAGLFQADAARICVESGMAPRCLRLMFEPGGGPLGDVLRVVDEMEAVIDRSTTTVPRLLHGGGDNSWAVIDEAARRGYQTRVGFEDSFVLPDGSTARDNGEMVAEALRRIRRIAGA